MSLILIVSGLGLWLLLATLFIALAVSAGRGDETEWVDVLGYEGGTVAPLHDAA